jgi:hypothetical protein
MDLNDLNDQVELEHLLFLDRECRTCREVKNLLIDFYLIRKNKTNIASSYSYECKECTKERIRRSRLKSNKKKKKEKKYSDYPDW